MTKRDRHNLRRLVGTLAKTPHKWGVFERGLFYEQLLSRHKTAVAAERRAKDFEHVRRLKRGETY